MGVSREIPSVLNFELFRFKRKHIWLLVAFAIAYVYIVTIPQMIFKYWNKLFQIT